jgi:hypothetical protein
MCQFVGISPFGTDAFLKNRLRQHLREIKQDDYEIEQEGVYVFIYAFTRSIAASASALLSPQGPPLASLVEPG